MRGKRERKKVKKAKLEYLEAKTPLTRVRLINDEGGFLGSGIRWLPGAPLW